MERKKSYFHSKFKSYYYSNFHKNLGSRSSRFCIRTYAGRRFLKEILIGAFCCGKKL